jgi:hypothetical protein
MVCCSVAMYWSPISMSLLHLSGKTFFTVRLWNSEFEAPRIFNVRLTFFTAVFQKPVGLIEESTPDFENSEELQTRYFTVRLQIFSIDRRWYLVVRTRGLSSQQCMRRCWTILGTRTCSRWGHTTRATCATTSNFWIRFALNRHLIGHSESRAGW